MTTLQDYIDLEDGVRSGRKRSAKPRHPGGQVVREQIKPTDEQQSRRNFAAGNGDPALTGYSLGVLWANEAIDDHQHRAGCRYKEIYEKVFGKVSIAAANYEGLERGHDRELTKPELKHLEGLQRELSRAADLLMDLGVKRETDSLCIHPGYPRWMRPVPPRPIDVEEAKKAMAGLRALVGMVNDG